MADIAARSLALSDGYGQGYRPVGSPVSPRYTVSKSTKDNGNGTGTITLTVTVKTNNGYIGGGYTLTLFFKCAGVQTSKVWKASAGNWNANSTYSTTIAVTIPLDGVTTKSADLWLTVNSGTYFTFRSSSQGGDQITGIPVGYQVSTFNSFSNFNSNASSISVSVTRRTSSLTNRMTLKIGSTTIQQWTNLGSFTSLSLSTAGTNAIHNALPSSTSATATMVMETLNGNTVIGSASKTATVSIPSSVAPSIGSFTASETITAVQNELGVGQYAMRFSRIQFRINSPSAGAGSSVSSYNVNFNGKNYTTQNPLSSAPTSSGNLTATATVTDKRGRTAVRTLVLSVTYIADTTFASASNFSSTASSVGVSITKNASAVTNTVVAKIGSTTIKTWSGVNTSTSLSLDSTTQTNIHNATSNTTTATVTFTLTAKLGTLTVNTVSRTATVTVGSSIVPTIGSISHAETVSSVSSIVGAYVQSLSRIRFTMNSVSAGAGSSISSYKIEFAGQSWTTSTATTGAINQSGNLVVTATATDRRGRVGTRTLTINVLAYALPRLTSFSALRSNSAGTADLMGTWARVNHSGTVSSLINGTQRNSLTLVIARKLRSSSTWTDIKTVTGVTSITGFSVPDVTFLQDASYDVRVTLSDKFNSVTAQVVVSTIKVAFSIGEDAGIGAGKIWEHGALDVGGDIYQNGTKVDLVNMLNNIGLLNGQIRGQQSIQGFDCNIRDTRFRVVSLYQGVNAPTQNIGVLMHIPYSADWIEQIFWDLQTGIWRDRRFHSGNTWSPWTVVGGSSYTLPTASASVLGGVKVGSNLSISSGVLSATNTTYGVATTGANGLMSSTDKTKLNGIATGATADPSLLTSTSGGTARCIRHGNGLQEIHWRRILTTTVTLPNANVYYSNNTLTTTNWPWAFNEQPTVQVTASGANQLAWAILHGTASATVCPVIYVEKGGSDSVTRDYTINISAFGKWK